MEPLSASSRSRSPLLPRSGGGSGCKMNSVRLSHRSGRENTHPNVRVDLPTSPSSSSVTKKASASVARLPTGSDCLGDGSVDSSHSPLKVVVRIRAQSGDEEKGGDRVVKNISSGSLSVGGGGGGDRTFTFDSVLDSESTQEDVFKLVGVPLVKNSLAGFNTSILSYGQTGSGKTYTMWGPPSAMVDGNSVNTYQGIVPRIFQMLFTEINRNQESSGEKQVHYQCRCSFLEIYNNQINDLLDPTQRNLQISDDSRNGFHVENLTEEYVTMVEDVTQILVKGLSNRKVGTISTNFKSSRSHILFTCIIESWCKGLSSKYFGSSKSSRINLIDLAGSDMDKHDDVSRHCREEARHVKHSLSKLGKVVKILAEVAHSGKAQKIPYMDSCLTHLLQETLGGNAKVTFICAISPNKRYKTGTLSTLRFGERAKLVHNKAVINEITEDDVNGLSDQIRQLKEELIKAKSYGGNLVGTTGGYSKGHSARDTLNLLRVSLNRALILPHIDHDSEEEEVDVDEEDARELCVQLSNIDPSSEDNSEGLSDNKNSMCISPSEESSITKIGSEEPNVNSITEETEVHYGISEPEVPSDGSIIPTDSGLVFQDVSDVASEHQHQGSLSKSSISISPLPSPHDPTLCESPKINNNLRKSIITSSNCFAVGNDSLDTPKFFTKFDNARSSLQSSKVCPTESLAVSLRRGLQIIDYHQKSSAVKRSLLSLSFEHLKSISHQPGVQSLEEDGVPTAPFLCSSCNMAAANGGKQVSGNSEMHIIPISDTKTSEVLKTAQVLNKDDDRILVDIIRREMELEALCSEQAATIKQLNCLVDQYKHNCEQSLVVEPNQHAKVVYLEGLADGASTMKQLENGHTELVDDKHTILNDNRACDEREALVEEIQSLRKQLESYKDASTDDSLLDQIRKGSALGKTGEEFEKELKRWTESESRWISLTEELRLDLESNRQLAEKKDIELSLEKQCTAELDDALQRAILGHVRFIEHYAELHEKHESLLWSHRKIMEGVTEVKRAAAKAGGKHAGSAFVAALAAELSTLRVERERERAYLKEQNKGLRIQLRDTAEAVHAAGELLVRLREAEETIDATEEKYGRAQQEIEKLRRQIEKMRKKHAMEMVTMKHYLAESRLPESALEPFYLHDESGSTRHQRSQGAPDEEEGHSWRAAFRPSYQ